VSFDVKLPCLMMLQRRWADGVRSCI